MQLNYTQGCILSKNEKQLQQRYVLSSQQLTFQT